MKATLQFVMKRVKLLWLAGQLRITAQLWNVPAITSKIVNTQVRILHFPFILYPNYHIYIYTDNAWVFGFIFLILHHFLFFFISFETIDSEVSFSLLSGNTGRSGTTSNGIRNSGHVLNNTRLIISPGSKPVKIAAISGKPRVQRYLSRECEFFTLLSFI